MSELPGFILLLAGTNWPLSALAKWPGGGRFSVGGRLDFRISTHLRKRLHFRTNLCIRLHLFSGSAKSRSVAGTSVLQRLSVLRRPDANVAQLVEQRFRKARVVSSILTVGSILYLL